MKKIYIILWLIIACALYAKANVAMPGIFNAGGATDFSPLHKKDSINARKVQMTSEFISVDLYKGFAVIKGEYRMYNFSGDSFAVTTGYPINENLEAGNKAGHSELFFDSLYAIKIRVNNVEVKPEKISLPGEKNNTNWYTWQTFFPPAKVTKIEVYFIMNTNDAHVRKGYNNIKRNGFLYILESGSSWGRDISKGDIAIHLNGGLTRDDVSGLLPAGKFLYSEKNHIFWYHFDNLKPTREDNIILTYYKQRADFIFHKIVTDAEAYFKTIDNLQTIFKENKEDYATWESPNPFDTGIYWDFYILVGVITIVIIVIPLLLVVYFIRRARRRRRNERPESDTEE